MRPKKHRKAVDGSRAVVALACLCLIGAAGWAGAAIPPSERAALIALYNSTSGDNWTNNSWWKTALIIEPDGFSQIGTEGSWYGVTVTSNHVSKIDLHYNNLVGTIPAAITDLNQLQYLELSDNCISGGIPSFLGDLTNLTFLNLSFINGLGGSIPPSFGSLSKLIFLGLSHSDLSGEIPPELGNLANIKELYIWDYNIIGNIPAELGNCHQLEHLQLMGRLSGDIPPQLGNLSNLSTLYLDSNRLSGAIPPELGLLQNLEQLSLCGNQLTGPIPSEIGNLRNLGRMKLNGNKLSGEIPGSLMNLTNLWVADLDLRWNAMYTSDAALRSFLDSRQAWGNWEDTQTVAPAGVTAEPTSPTSIRISWTPIRYTEDGGGYRVFGRPEGGPWALLGVTANKSVSWYEASVAVPGRTYHFRLQTWTDPHPYNLNTVLSEFSAEVSATTPPDAVAPAITTQPRSQVIRPGGSAILSVTAAGTPPLQYQWYRGASGDRSNPVASGAPTFQTSPLQTTLYWVLVTNAFGSAASDTATVAMMPPTWVWVGHVTAVGGWLTSLSVYNPGPGPAEFQVAKYGAGGALLGTSPPYTAPPKTWAVVPPADLGYEGTACVSSERLLLVKLSYQYGSSPSVCEFCLTSGLGRNWVVPNTGRSWFSYSGIALTNPNPVSVTVTLEAWRNRVEISRRYVTLEPNERFAVLSDQVWAGVHYDDFDTMVIRAAGDIPAPISITGNTAQDRHLFFAARPEPSAGPTAALSAADAAGGGTRHGLGQDRGIETGNPTRGAGRGGNRPPPR